MFSEIVNQICTALSGVVPAPFGDVIGQFCELLTGFLQSFSL